MQSFQVLFDRGEPALFPHEAYRLYGELGFPAAPDGRPWIYSNFVQSLDGVASFKGLHPTGADISRSAEDRWLMDLLRAHADALLLGANTLAEETQFLRQSRNPASRGPVYAIEDEHCLELRSRVAHRAETNIIVTGGAALDLSQYAVFDGDRVDAVIITTAPGARRLAERHSHPHVRVIVAGEGELVDLPQAMRRLRVELGIERLLCEGGPTLYGYMSRAALMDEKFITVAPLEIGVIIPPEQKAPGWRDSGTPAPRPTTFNAPGFTFETAPEWHWMSCRKVRDHQFNRYRRAQP
ncbi:MAG: dihydrofolate reductase family protein [Acidobacteria bacterium]|nr:dihydrofolate reductase family protein [Acidobacteriota bacterium]